MGNKKFLIWILLGLLFVLHLKLFSVTLRDELKILEPLTGKKWIGDLKSPDGKNSWKTFRQFTVLWDGTAVRYNSSTPRIASYAEGYFYWDREAGKISLFMVNSRGVIIRGIVSPGDGVIAIEGRITFPERSFEFRNTFEFSGEGRITDRWFQNAFGPWMPGHVINLMAEKTRGPESSQ
jgi:hypothetical protein